MRAIPTPGDRDVLIKVAAAGVNGADLRERQGKYPVPAGAPDLMGLEVSGEIIEVGLNCDRNSRLVTRTLWSAKVSCALL